MENLYLEGTVNKIFEDVADFDWIGNVPTERPSLKFKGKEIWVDFDGLSVSDRVKVLNIIDGEVELARETENQYLEAIGDPKRLTGVFVHCAHEDNEFNPIEGYLCISTNDFAHEMEYGGINPENTIFVNGYELLVDNISESDDFDWIGNVPTNPLKFNKPKINLDNVQRDLDGYPLIDGNGEGEIWLDVSDYSDDEKRSILDSVEKLLGKLYLENTPKWCFNDITKGFLIHCGHEDNNFFAQENHVCCMKSTYEEFMEEEENLHNPYTTNTTPVERPYVDGGIFLNGGLMKESEEEKESDVNKSLKEVLSDLKIAPKFLFTFGTGIGGLLGPVTKLLEGSGISLNQVEVGLLVVTALSFIVQDTDFKKLKEELINRDLFKHLGGVTEFINGTQKVINGVLKKVTGVSYGMMDILGFTFIMVPVTKILTQLIGEYGITVDSVNQLLSGLAAGVLSYSVKSVINRIKERL